MCSAQGEIKANGPEEVKWADASARSPSSQLSVSDQVRWYHTCSVANCHRLWNTTERACGNPIISFTHLPHRFLQTSVWFRKRRGNLCRERIGGRRSPVTEETCSTTSFLCFLSLLCFFPEPTTLNESHQQITMLPNSHKSPVLTWRGDVRDWIHDWKRSDCSKSVRTGAKWRPQKTNGANHTKHLHTSSCLKTSAQMTKWFCCFFT